MVVKLFKALIIFIFSLLVIGCQHDRTNYQIVFSEPDNTSNEFENGESPIRVAIASVLSPTETVMYYRTIAEYIGEQLNRPAILIQRKSYNEISNLMIKGGADIAFFPTGAYISNSELEGIEAIVMQERLGLPYYYGYIVVNSESNITSIEDLKGKNVAFTDPTSYSGYIFFENKLAKLGETPQHFLGSYNFTYHHENTLNAVTNKVVDAAAVNSLAFDRAQLEQPELVQDLKIIAKSNPIGTGPIVVRSNLSNEDKKLITESLISMHQHENMLPALQGLFIDRFVPFDAELYEVNHELDK